MVCRVLYLGDPLSELPLLCEYDHDGWVTKVIICLRLDEDADM